MPRFEIKPDCYGEYPLNASQYAERCCADCRFEDECYTVREVARILKEEAK